MSSLDNERPVVVFLILLMLTAVFSGCTGLLGDDTEPEPEPEPELADWDVYYVDSGSDLPACGSATLGRLYYVASTAGFETCTSAGWAFVDLTGPAGADGVVGLDGADGSDGEKGEVGADGADGENGVVGADGTDGADGADGQDGSASSNTLLARITTPTLQACSSGGRIIEHGLDNGDGGGTAQNGVLEGGEVDHTTTYCSNFVVKRIADIYPGGASGYANDITVMGSRLYFQATDGSNGYELWAYETANGSTWQVADIYPSGGGGNALALIHIRRRRR